MVEISIPMACDREDTYNLGIVLLVTQKGCQEMILGRGVGGYKGG